MRYRIPIVATALLVAALIAAGPASAQSEQLKKTHASFGVFITDQDSSTAFEADAGIGSSLNFEGDLGLESSLDVFRFDGEVHFGARHGIYASVFDLSREAAVDVTVDISWRDSVFPTSANLATDLDLEIYKLAYGYDFLQGENHLLSGTIGLYVADLGITLTNLDSQEFETGDVTAPLPVFGLRGAYAASSRWVFYASAEYFVASIDNIDGSILDSAVGVDYWFSDGFALGLGYNYVQLDADARGDDLGAELKWDYSGAILALKFSF